MSEELDLLPEDDADARLARRIDEGRALSRSDPFEQALATFRERVGSTSVPTDLSTRLWARVRPSSPGTLSLVPRWTRWAMAAAAVVLLAFGFWAIIGRQPVLVAQSGSEITTVSLDDGSSVVLRPNSTLRQTGGHYLIDGEAFFDVRHSPDRTFRVRTDLGEIRVLGTRFDVSTWGNGTDVYLEKGRVVFESADDARVDTLLPGNVLSASKGDVSIRQSQSGRYTAWMEAGLVFGGRSVQEILVEMEHHFAIRVSVPDSLATITLSGRVLLSSPEQSLDDLGRVLGARFESVGPRTYRLKPN